MSLQPSHIKQKLMSRPSLTLISGPAYTGKSALINSLFDAEPDTIIFGTADPRETAFEQRIVELKNQRPQHWLTEEDNTELIPKLQSCQASQLAIDSLNQWIASRLLHSAHKYSHNQLQDHLNHECNELIKSLEHIHQQKSQHIILTYSEIASGITPPSPTARLYRQWSSQTACKIAQQADYVITTHLGLLQLLKP